MKSFAVKTPVSASGLRSLDLESVAYAQGDIVVVVREDDRPRSWKLTFQTTQALRVTTFESAYGVLKDLDGCSAVYEFKESELLSELGLGRLEFMRNARHFVICSYQEVVEVVAWSMLVESFAQKLEDH